MGDNVFGKATLARSESHNGPREPVFLENMLDDVVEFSALGTHPIVQAWEAGTGPDGSGPSLFGQIKDQVDRSSARPHLQQVAIVPLRAGPSSTPDHKTVTVVILVTPGTMASDCAAGIAHACRSILDR